MNSLDTLTTQLQQEFSAEVTEDVSPPIATPKESTGVKTIQLFSTEEKKEPVAPSNYLSIMRELIKPIQKAITQQGLASISKDILGSFLNSFPVDSSWELEELFETGLIPNCNLFQTNKIINTLTQKINNRLNSCV